MSLDNPFAMHYQSVWEERAAQRDMPMWARVSFLAFARHKANGHAIFAKGQLALLLGRPTEDGFKPADKSNVQRAIRAAISNKWLDPESCSECLVVPSHAVQGGLGSENEKCSVHDRKAHLRQSRKAKLDTSKDRS
ncbi:hypothetical protein ACTWP6_27365 [Mycobacterium sp. 4D054]|uniref:hypothetical protein n=1 Tax=Mycobacterium sp. 4D054 TaxID=3457440 RepID=UPI003FD020EC